MAAGARRLSSGLAKRPILPGMVLLQPLDLAQAGTLREGRPEWRLQRALMRDGVTVPTGYVTDLFSIAFAWSRLVGWLVLMLWQPKPGPQVTAAVMHDWLYETMLFGGDNAGRKRADDLFRDIMIETGLPPWRVAIFHRAVRLFGGRGYGKVTHANRQLVADFWSAGRITGGGA